MLEPGVGGGVNPSFGKFRSLSPVMVSTHVNPSRSVFLFVPGSPVQGDERNSTEEHSVPQADLDPRSQTGTILTSQLPIGPGAVTGTAGARGRVHQGQEKWPSRPPAVSSSTSQFQGRLRPTSPPPRLSVAGNTDREALLLPEETTNNRADASGATHLADGPLSATQRTRPYFQNTFSSGTFHTSRSANTESYESPQTQTPVTPSAAGSSGDTARTDVSGHTSELFTISRHYPSSSSSATPGFTSSQPELPSWVTWKRETTLNPRGVSPEPGDQPSRNQRSTDALNADLASASAATSEPLKTPTAQQKGGWGSVPSTRTSSPSVETPGEVSSAPTHLTDPSAASLRPDGSDDDSVTPNAAPHTSASESPDQSESEGVFHAFTSPPPSQTSSLRSTAPATRSALPDSAPPSTQPNREAWPTPTALRESQSVSPLPDGTLTASPSSPTTAATPEDVARDAAATGSDAGSESRTQGPTFTLLHQRPPTVSPTPFLNPSPARSSERPLSPRTHAGSHPSQAAPTSPEPSGRSGLWKHETTPSAPGPSPVQPMASHTPGTPATHNKPNDVSTTSASGHRHGEEKEDPTWLWLPSSTAAGPPQKPPQTTQDHRPGSHAAPSSDVPTPSTGQTPRFFIVADQPVAIKGAESRTCDLKHRYAPGSVCGDAL